MDLGLPQLPPMGHAPEAGFLQIHPVMPLVEPAACISPPAPSLRSDPWHVLASQPHEAVQLGHVEAVRGVEHVVLVILSGGEGREGERVKCINQLTNKAQARTKKGPRRTKGMAYMRTAGRY